MEYEQLKDNYKKLKVGDLLLNPYIWDFWIVSNRYNQEKEKDELFIVLIHEDYCEDIEIAYSFIKIGNIYDIVDDLLRKQDLVDYLEDKIILCKGNMKKLKKYPETNEYEIIETDTKKDTYQEILDKIKEGNYEQ